jgi:hypothetical protein
MQVLEIPEPHYLLCGPRMVLDWALLGDSNANMNLL